MRVTVVVDRAFYAPADATGGPYDERTRCDIRQRSLADGISLWLCGDVHRCDDRRDVDLPGRAHRRGRCARPRRCLNDPSPGPAPGQPALTGGRLPEVGASLLPSP